MQLEVTLEMKRNQQKRLRKGSQQGEWGGRGGGGKCVILEVKKQISEKGVITLSHYAHKSMKMKTENRI